MAGIVKSIKGVGKRVIRLPFRHRPDYSKPRQLLKDGKINILDCMVMRAEILNDWKTKRLRVCLECEKPRLIKFFLGESKYCSYCKIKLKKLSSVKRKESKIKYINSEKGIFYKQTKNRNHKLKIKGIVGDGSITTFFLKQLLNKQKNKCAKCGLDITNKKLRQLDHIKPMSKGGMHVKENVQWLCSECNRVKGNTYEK